MLQLLASTLDLDSRDGNRSWANEDLIYSNYADIHDDLSLPDLFAV